MDTNDEILAREQHEKPPTIVVSLQHLWRKTSILLRQHPLLLWSPFLIADIAKYWTALAGKHLSRAVIYTLLPHSVFSGQPDPLPPNSHFLTILLLAGGAVTWVFYALSFLLYSIAFVFIAHRVYNSTVSTDRAIKLQMRLLIAKASQLALVLTLLSLAAALLWGWIISLLRVNLFFWTLLGALAVIAASILAAKPFLRAASFSRDATCKFTSRTIVLAWILLTSALVGSVLLSLLLTHADIPFPLHPSTPLVHFYGVLISLIAAIPYVPMMIGITLLAEEHS